MGLGEFALIDRYFRKCGVKRADVRVGVGEPGLVLVRRDRARDALLVGVLSAGRVGVKELLGMGVLVDQLLLVGRRAETVRPVIGHHGRVDGEGRGNGHGARSLVLRHGPKAKRRCYDALAGGP